jgi:hypothetical protein
MILLLLELSAVLRAGFNMRGDDLLASNCGQDTLYYCTVYVKKPRRSAEETGARDVSFYSLYSTFKKVIAPLSTNSDLTSVQSVSSIETKLQQG